MNKQNNVNPQNKNRAATYHAASLELEEILAKRSVSGFFNYALLRYAHASLSFYDAQNRLNAYVVINSSLFLLTRNNDEHGTFDYRLVNDHSEFEAMKERIK